MNSPASFQRFIKEVFKEHLKEGILLVYIDDVIILIQTEEQALERRAATLNTTHLYGSFLIWQSVH